MAVGECRGFVGEVWQGMAGMSGVAAVSWGKVCYGELGFVWARHGSRGRESSGTVGSGALR